MMDNDNAPRPVNADTEQVCAECASRGAQADDAQARSRARCVMLAGHALELDAGDSLARMERVAAHAGRVLGEARARREALGGTDAGEDALYALMRMADGLFMAQDENTRLRRDMLGLRQRQFELERRCDELNRELSMLRLAQERAQAECEGISEHDGQEEAESGERHDTAGQ